MDYLRQQGAYRSAVRPDIILLDLNMPRKDGREVLREVKADPILREIPVLVLTTSAARSDIKNAYALHANTYLTKPVDLTRYETLIQAVEDFWFRNAQLPNREDNPELT
jgi:CheY-like chemotaxis protein